MVQIILPRLETQIWQQTGNKNSVVQLLSGELSVESSVIGSGRSHLVIGSDEIKVCLTCNADNFPADQDYVLLVNKKPTEAKLLSKEIKFKRWLKHPKMRDCSVADVIESWNNCFSFIEEDIEKEILGLRTPQIGAIHSVLGHLKVSDKTGTVVLPTGTGKTETMLSVLIANKCQKVLIVVPSDVLREQIFNKFVTLGLLKDFKIVNENALYPKVGILKQQFDNIDQLNGFFRNCNVVITTMHLIANSSTDFQKKIADTCSHLFIDEAHHVKAISWEEFKKMFAENKVLQFTATPFRNDGKRLDGQIIFNFPLKKAQAQGYFKKINFIPVKKYSLGEADAAIAEKAVEQLKKDIQSGFNHILMARCDSKTRAQSVFKLYEQYSDLQPVVLYSGMKDKKEIMKRIRNKEHKIIVTVDMLGEGFDLPELKVAAFHDVRKSLPVTLQFAGRFTRTKLDEKLGEASFIANIVDLKVKAELEELYAQDSDWNSLLPSISAVKVDDKINFEEFIAGFQGLGDSSIPFQNIRPALSTVVYRNHTDNWRPENFVNGIPAYDESEYKFHDINNDKKILVIIHANRTDVEWGNFKGIYQLEWNVIIVFWDTSNKLLFIHSSDKSSLYKDLAIAIIGENAELINQINVFKAFYGINRVMLQNVGLKEFLGKNIRFRMSVGTDVESALSLAEKKKGQKAFVFGVGYEDGEKISLGCSYKGRIWSYMKGDLIQFQEWCLKLGKKLTNAEIDPNQILKETLIPELITTRPAAFPVWVDWDEEMYNFPESKYSIKIGGSSYDLSSCELQISSPSQDGNLFFDLVTDNEVIKLEKSLFENTEKENVPDFKIINHTGTAVTVQKGSKTLSIEEFFYSETPTIWFADGSSLTGNNYVKLKQILQPFTKDQLIAWDWNGVDLSKESQGVEPKITNSIQHKVIEALKAQDFSVIYDDDYSGEIADIVAIKEESDKLKVHFYHLKYAKNGTVSNRVDNFYEVCGQAQKSIHWKHKSGEDFFKHLLKRETKKRNGATCSRLEKGTKEDLEKLQQIAKRKIPMEFEIVIVQPALSKANPSDEILTLLGVTENFLMELAKIKLNVIVNE